MWKKVSSKAEPDCLQELCKAKEIPVNGVAWSTGEQLWTYC